ncbi:ABC transporter ATP-binding protein, partial [Dictyoglomus thermophilum]
MFIISFYLVKNKYRKNYTKREFIKMKEDFNFLTPKKEDISLAKLKILLPYFKIHLGSFVIASIFLIISSFITIPVPYL